MGKERIDKLLIDKGFFESREKARGSIMAGIVYVYGQKVDKPGTNVDVSAPIEIKGNLNPFVSRGGLKLDKAVKYFDIKLKDLITMDVGASTGGFTDCMLKNGARKVFAVDVGYGQLAWQLRNDPRVVCMERTNIRYVKPEDVGVEINFTSIDVSFISLKKVLPVVYQLQSKEAETIALIKPQFEAGRDKVGKRGVVRDPEVHKDVIKNISDFCLEQNFKIKGLTFSPIKGPEGNIEYLLFLTKKEIQTVKNLDLLIEKTVYESHENLES